MIKSAYYIIIKNESCNLKTIFCNYYCHVIESETTSVQSSDKGLHYDRDRKYSVVLLKAKLVFIRSLILSEQLP